MSDFQFKDDDDDLSMLPSVQEPASPASAPPTPPMPQAPKLPTPPQNVNASLANTGVKAAPTVPSPPLPIAPSTKAPAPKAPSPSVPLPTVASPPLPKISGAVPNPTVPNTTIPSPAAPSAAASSAAPAMAHPAAPSAGVSAAPKMPAGGASSTRTAAPSPATVPTIAQSAAPKTPATPRPASAPPIAAKTAGAKTPGATAPSTDELLGGELARRQMTLTAHQNVQDIHETLWNRVLDFLAPIAVWILRAAAVLGGLSLAYLAWGMLSGDLGHAAPSSQVITNVGMAVAILRWALLGVAVAWFILMWEERLVAAAVVAVGLLLYFGAAPIMKMSGGSPAIGTIAGSLGAGGRALATLGMLKVAYDVMQWITELPNRMRVRADVGVAQHAEPQQRREAQNATMFSPCWKLPFCREVIRKQCPAYLAKTTCWKFGRGCYCDEEMISRIVRGESMDNVKAPTRMSRQGKPPCHRCYIFLEHQGMKYRVASPMAVPLTIAIMYFGWNTYMALTGKVGGSLQFLWDKLAFHGTSVVTSTVEKVAETGSKANTLSPAQLQHTAQTMFGVMVGFYLLIMISKGIEWAIYKARI